MAWFKMKKFPRVIKFRRKRKSSATKGSAELTDTDSEAGSEFRGPSKLSLSPFCCTAAPREERAPPRRRGTRQVQDAPTVPLVPPTAKVMLRTRKKILEVPADDSLSQSSELGLRKPSQEDIKVRSPGESRLRPPDPRGADTPSSPQRKLSRDPLMPPQPDSKPSSKVARKALPSPPVTSKTSVGTSTKKGAGDSGQPRKGNLDRTDHGPSERKASRKICDESDNLLDDGDVKTLPDKRCDLVLVADRRQQVGAEDSVNVQLDTAVVGVPMDSDAASPPAMAASRASEDFDCPCCDRVSLHAAAGHQQASTEMDCSRKSDKELELEAQVSALQEDLEAQRRRILAQAERIEGLEEELSTMQRLRSELRQERELRQIAEDKLLQLLDRNRSEKRVESRGTQKDDESGLSSAESSPVIMGYESRVRRYQSYIQKLEKDNQALTCELRKIKDMSQGERLLEKLSEVQRCSQQQQLQYESCMDEVAGRLVHTLLVQKRLEEECRVLHLRVEQLEQENGTLLEMCLDDKKENVSKGDCPASALYGRVRPKQPPHHRVVAPLALHKNPQEPPESPPSEPKTSPSSRIPAFRSPVKGPEARATTRKELHSKARGAEGSTKRKRLSRNGSPVDHRQQRPKKSSSAASCRPPREDPPQHHPQQVWSFNCELRLGDPSSLFPGKLAESFRRLGVDALCDKSAGTEADDTAESGSRTKDEGYSTMSSDLQPDSASAPNPSPAQGQCPGLDRCAASDDSVTECLDGSMCSSSDSGFGPLHLVAQEPTPRLPAVSTVRHREQIACVRPMLRNPRPDITTPPPRDDPSFSKSNDGTYSTDVRPKTDGPGQDVSFLNHPYDDVFFALKSANPGRPVSSGVPVCDSYSTDLHAKLDSPAKDVSLLPKRASLFDDASSDGLVCALRPKLDVSPAKDVSFLSKKASLFDDVSSDGLVCALRPKLDVSPAKDVPFLSKNASLFDDASSDGLVCALRPKLDVSPAKDVPFLSKKASLFDDVSMALKSASLFDGASSTPLASTPKCPPPKVDYASMLDYWTCARDVLECCRSSNTWHRTASKLESPLLGEGLVQTAEKGTLTEPQEEVWREGTLAPFIDESIWSLYSSEGDIQVKHFPIEPLLSEPPSLDSLANPCTETPGERKPAPSGPRFGLERVASDTVLYLKEAIGDLERSMRRGLRSSKNVSSLQNSGGSSESLRPELRPELLINLERVLKGGKLSTRSSPTKTSSSGSIHSSPSHRAASGDLEDLQRSRGGSTDPDFSSSSEGECENSDHKDFVEHWLQNEMGKNEPLAEVDPLRGVIVTLVPSGRRASVPGTPTAPRSRRRFLSFPQACSHQPKTARSRRSCPASAEGVHFVDDEVKEFNENFYKLCSVTSLKSLDCAALASLSRDAQNERLPRKLNSVPRSQDVQDGRLPPELTDVPMLRDAPNERLPPRLPDVPRSEDVPNERLPPRLPDVPRSEDVPNEKLPPRLPDVPRSEDVPNERLPPRLPDVPRSEDVPNERLPPRLPDIPRSEDVPNDRLSLELTDVPRSHDVLNDRLPPKLSDVPRSQDVLNDRLPPELNDVPGSQDVPNDRFSPEINDVSRSQNVLNDRLPAELPNVPRSRDALDDRLPPELTDVVPRSQDVTRDRLPPKHVDVPNSPDAKNESASPKPAKGLKPRDAQNDVPSSRPFDETTHLFPDKHKPLTGKNKPSKPSGLVKPSRPALVVASDSLQETPRCCSRADKQSASSCLPSKKALADRVPSNLPVLSRKHPPRLSSSPPGEKREAGKAPCPPRTGGSKKHHQQAKKDLGKRSCLKEGHCTAWIHLPPKPEFNDPMNRLSLLNSMRSPTSSSGSSSEEELEPPTSSSHLQRLCQERRYKVKASAHHRLFDGGAPRSSIVGRRELFYRFGDQEKEAIAAFDFLEDLPQPAPGLEDRLACRLADEGGPAPSCWRDDCELSALDCLDVPDHLSLSDSCAESYSSTPDSPEDAG